MTPFPAKIHLHDPGLLEFDPCVRKLVKIGRVRRKLRPSWTRFFPLYPIPWVRTGMMVAKRLE